MCARRRRGEGEHAERQRGQRVEAGQRAAPPGAAARRRRSRWRHRSTAPPTSSAHHHDADEPPGAGLLAGEVRRRARSTSRIDRGVVEPALGLERRGHPPRQRQPAQGGEDGRRVGRADDRGRAAGRTPSEASSSQTVIAAVTPTLTTDADGRQREPGPDGPPHVGPPGGQTTLGEDDDQRGDAEGLGELGVLELARRGRSRPARGRAPGRAAGWAGRAGRPAGGRPPPRGRRAHRRQGDGDRGVHRPPLPMGAVSRTGVRRAIPRRTDADVRRNRFGRSGRMGAVSAPSPAGPFAALPPQVDLPALEQEILQRWEADKVFARSLEASAGRPQWVFYEGPPTANGRPGTHHIEARAFKDVFPRFKTMQGWHVPRRAGWDCHGLPVEIAVEQELGFAGKPDIERYGIAEFNARCRESVERHVDSLRRAHPSAWATGSTCPPPTGRWTRPTSRASGGRSSRSSTRACWSRTTASPRTARAAAPGCPTTRSPRATRRSPTRRSTCGCRSPAASGPARPTCSSGRRRRGRCRRTPPSPCTPTSPTSSPRTDDGTLRRRRAAAGRRPGRGRRGARPHDRPRLGAGAPTSGPFELVEFPEPTTRTSSSSPTT